MTGGGLALHGSSFLRVWAISMNLGGGHWGWESDRGWCGLNPHAGVAGASAVAVACMDVVVGQPLPQGVGMDPLRWPLLLSDVALFGFLWHGLHWPWWGYFHPVGWHCGHEDLFPLQKRQVAPLPTRVPAHSPPDDEVGQQLGDAPPWPSTAKPLCKW